MKNKNTDLIIDAALDIIEDQGWLHLSFVQIAQKVQLPLYDIRQLYACKTDIIRDYICRLDQQVLQNINQDMEDGDLSPRDRLFDIMMDRYEAMNTRRVAIISILDAMSFDLANALCLAGQGKRSMIWMLEAAGIGTQGIAGKLRVKGLFAIHLYVLRKWKHDETPDLSMTMVSLDQSLNRAEQLVNTLGLDDR